MQTRSKVAAGAASVIPFHCVICFDEFNLKDRTPMVLPCGHTYVCLKCSKRLKRCMECREPLFLTMPAASQLSKPTSTSRSLSYPNQHRGVGMGGRYSPSFSPQPQQLQPQQSAAQIPLPIPKNVVLVSLMEAAERQVLDARSEQEPRVVKKAAAHEDENATLLEDPTNNLEVQLDEGEVPDNDDDDDSTATEDDEEEFNLDRIISGMATFSGPCGTYAVTEDQVVVVQPNDPRTSTTETALSSSSCDEKKTEDARDANSVVDANTKVEEQVITAGEGLPDELAKESFVLRKGQTVQVVSLEDGVAKLARGAGYVVLGSSSHLVKVSGPQEAVCRLEGLLDTIEGRGRDLQATLDENRQIELSLLTQIQAEMQSEPNHPVISKAPDLDLWLNDYDDDDDDENQNESHFKNKENLTDSIPHPTTPTAAVDHVAFPQTPDSRTSQSHRRNSGAQSLPGSAESTDGRVGHGLSQSPVSIDNADLHRSATLPIYRRTVSEDDMDQLVFGCGVALLGEGSSGLFSAAPSALAPFETMADLRNEYHNTHGSVSTSAVLPSRPRSATEHQYHHDYATPTLTSSFDGIDFRTGLSGHRGLNHVTSKASTHSPTPRYRHMRMMSEHRGIARARGPPARRDSPTTTVPTFGPRFSPYPFAAEGGDSGDIPE